MGQPNTEDPPDLKTTLSALGERLSTGKARQAWRSLAELAETPEFLQALKEEFPRETSWIASINRRDFLKLLGASLALAGLTSCLPLPAEKIMPYIQAPEELVPGKPLYFATAMEMDGYARGLLVESQMGRPIKVEGNPDHPASLGATDVFAQASVLSLYDPDRAQVVSQNGQISTLDVFQADLARALDGQAGSGAGLRLLAGTITSPTLASQVLALMKKFPQAKVHQYDPAHSDNPREGARLAFGQPVSTRYHFDRANVILSLDDNFVLQEPGNLRYLREFASRRQVPDRQAGMNRLYVVESSLTTTGGFADHRLPLKASQVEGFTRRLAKQLGLAVDPGPGDLPIPQGWIEALAADLQENRGACLVLPGLQQSPAVHALAHSLNDALGNVGRTVVYTDPVEAFPANQGDSLRELASDLQAGKVDLLVVLGGNPVYSAPADLGFAGDYRKARLSIYLGQHQDETAALSNWFIPAAHFLEAWGDTRAFDGTVTIQQPLIQPLYGGMSSYEMIDLLLGQAGASGYDILRQFWQNPGQGSAAEGTPVPTQAGSNPTPTPAAAAQADAAPTPGGTPQAGATPQPGGGQASPQFEAFWKQALHDGVVPNTALPEKPFPLRLDLGTLPAQDTPRASGGLELVFLPDPNLWDGRFANNAWLQELPRPVTKLTWDNAVLVSPQTASRLGVSTQDVVELEIQGRTVSGPVWVLPGQPDDSVALSLGYGRSQGGSVLEGTGFNAFALRTSSEPWFGGLLEIRKTGRTYPLATTQVHFQMEGRDLVRSAKFDDFRKDANLFHKSEGLASPEGTPPTFYQEFPNPGYAWGMAVNANTCIGCNACVIACQAENNIPVVGKDQVLNSREMHWLRIDTYFEGSLENPDVLFAPVPCMHCENAPCEPVCPVEATQHSSEGMNEMVYNRCVGTRYCSNNCPYKVRRFNFYQYTDANSIPLKLLRNPDVTVRGRGVMEKCTYCVQRINEVRIQAEVEGRPIKDGEIVPACAQACPTQAIVFGNIKDPNSQVSKLKGQPQNYAMLGELGTRPRTTYLGKLRNPNPFMPE